MRSAQGDARAYQNQLLRVLTEFAGHRITCVCHPSSLHYLLESVQICGYFLGRKLTDQSECHASEAAKWGSHDFVDSCLPRGGSRGEIDVPESSQPRGTDGFIANQLVFAL